MLRTRPRSSAPADPDASPRRHRRAAGPELARAFAWLALIGWAVFAVMPIAWLLLAATKDRTQLATDPPFSFGSWQTLTSSWQDLRQFNDGAIVDWIWNTVILTAGGVALTVAATIPAGYALGACNFRLRKPLLVLSLVLMLMPTAALALPLFLQMSALGLVGDRLAVILPMSVFPFGVYLAFIYFSTTISRDTYDAARMDGCSEWQVFWRIALPLSWPITALVTFFAFFRNWNDFFLPFIMLGSDKYPLPVGLATLAEVSRVLNPGTSDAVSSVGVPELILATIITMVPVLVAVIVAQRTILKGASLLGGGLRG
ncbi:carbohydrate ABC transporter permease [Jiangella asiatica]|uniref:carbohydrate ABC transporter permease n=1 Tax=Jiangella asiatica TaxID=2530372 RepID=UPI00193CB468|nr:carbohydrate ABC transporter permease [Jiangella asiatica]